MSEHLSADHRAAIRASIEALHAYITAWGDDATLFTLQGAMSQTAVQIAQRLASGRSLSAPEMAQQHLGGTPQLSESLRQELEQAARAYNRAGH